MEIDCFTVWRLKVWDQNTVSVGLILRAVRQNLFHASLLAAGGLLEIFVFP